jgi:hypothetical protein
MEAIYALSDERVGIRILEFRKETVDGFVYPYTSFRLLTKE